MFFLVGCALQSGEESSCVLYDQCSPFLQMLTNMKQPFPPEIPELMRDSWLCNVRNVGGISLPEICCPKQGVVELTPKQKYFFFYNCFGLKVYL
jgi:hypothetical protein